jgi:hypothetical protein
MIYHSEGKHCGCKDQEQCTCKSKMGDYPKMAQHGYDKCDMPKKSRYDEKDHCPSRVTGFNLCRKINELRCFKHCEPVSQPCNETAYNYFTSRTNFDFSGLIVVSNTGNPPSGCAMEVIVTDRAGVSNPIIVNPGASVPIFVEGLISLTIACIPGVEVLPITPTCSGEIIFDLEYCATKTCL